MPQYPSAAGTDANLFVAANNLSTYLSDNPLTIGATTVNVASTTGFPTTGYVTIDAEAISYTGLTGTSFTGCTRGADGTTATSHVTTTNVLHNAVAAHHNVLKEEIKAIEGDLVTAYAAVPSATTMTTALASLQGKQLPVIRPETYGALGDGSTDDAVAIQAAITAIGVAGGGTLVFSSKTYLIGDELTLVSNLEMAGCQGATIKVKNAANKTLFYASSKTKLYIHDLTLDGNKANNTSGVWPHATGATLSLSMTGSVRVSNCRIINSYYGIGVYDQGANNVVIERCYFTNCAVGVDNYGYGHVIADNVFESMVGPAIQIEPTTAAGNNINEANGDDSTWVSGGVVQGLETSIHGNTIRGATHGIIIFNGTVGCTITDNHIANCTNTGINAQAHVKSLVISGNTIRNVTGTNVDGNPWNATGAGISLASLMDGVVCTDNVVEYCWVGIYGDTQKRTVISNNVIQFCRTSGICLYASSGCVVAGNVLYNNALERTAYANNSGIIFNGCINCTVSENQTTDTNGGYQVSCLYLFGTNTGHCLGYNLGVGLSSNIIGNGGTTVVSSPSASAGIPESSPLNFVAGFRITAGKRIDVGTAAPASGNWGVSAVVLNTNPSEAGSAGSKYMVLGWMCTAGGTPGTWLPLRCLTGN